MHITYHGLSCFKIVAKTAGRGSDDVTVVLGPFDKSLGLKTPNVNADIALLPHPDKAYGNPDALRGEPVVVHMPGEYAVKGINIVGIDAAADPRGGEDRGNTVIYVMDIEEMKVVYLGALGGELAPDQLDVVIGADILFLPVGDEGGMDGKTAEVMARKIEAKMIIPMQYDVKGVKGVKLRDTKDFCSNIGNCPSKGEDKLVVKAADISDKKMDVVTLNVS